MNTDELKTDDEILREQGMEDGPKDVSKFNLRPVTALTFSWMLRTGIFGDDLDAVAKSAAFAFLHTKNPDEVRAVVNNRSQFLNAVDEWIEKNVKHHSELQPVTHEMTDAVTRYLASNTTAAHPSDAMPDGPKN